MPSRRKSASPADSTAVVPLYAYQRRWINDKSRFKIAVKSVQIGWTWAMALELAFDMMQARTTWLWMSGSQRQSREAAEYTKTHLQAMGVAGAALDIDVEEFFGKTQALVDRVVMPNGSRAFFLPANPNTARGFAGNVVLDEFAIHESAREIWAAMVGRISRGYKLRVFSSPKGAVGKFWDLARQCKLDNGVAPDPNPARRGVWSAHWVDLPMAKADGCPIDAEELREAMGDDDLYAQECLCQFLDAESQLIPSEMIEVATSPRATLELAADYRPAALYMGTDVGRVRDLTVHAGVEQVAESFVTRFVDVQRKATFAAQKARIEEYLPLVRRHAMDATGIGMQQAEELLAEFPAKCEPVEFNLEIKSSMALGLKRLFEERRIEIPDDRELKSDLKAIKRIITDAGNVRYDARRSENGHGDRFWALALAVHASDGTAMPLSDGVCVGRGRVTAAGADSASMPRGDWFYPDHSSDRNASIGRFGGVL